MDAQLKYSNMQIWSMKLWVPVQCTLYRSHKSNLKRNLNWKKKYNRKVNKKKLKLTVRMHDWSRK